MRHKISNCNRLARMGRSKAKNVLKYNTFIHREKSKSLAEQDAAIVATTVLQINDGHKQDVAEMTEAVAAKWRQLRSNDNLKEKAKWRQLRCNDNLVSETRLESSACVCDTSTGNSMAETHAHVSDERDGYKFGKHKISQIHHATNVDITAKRKCDDIVEGGKQNSIVGNQSERTDRDKVGSLD